MPIIMIFAGKCDQGRLFRFTDQLKMDRYLYAARLLWAGLSTFCQEQEKKVVNPCLNDELELDELIGSPLNVKAGFTLTDPQDPRYQTVQKHKTRFGEILLRAASALRKSTGGEDHIDAVLGVVKGIDVYLLDYCISRGSLDTLRKNYLESST